MYAGAGGRTSAQGYAWDGVRQQFTTYERDAETGLDYARARYYSASCGRFSSPDPFAGSMSAADPQTLNRYSYVANDPLNLSDPSGTVASRPGSPQPGDLTVLSGTISDGMSTAHQSPQAAQPTPSAPVIPPISSELAGSPVYQEQRAQGITMPSGVMDGYTVQITWLLSGESSPCRQFMDRVFGKLMLPQPARTFEGVVAHIAPRTVLVNATGLLDDAQGMTRLDQSGTITISLDFANIKPSGPYSFAYVYAHEITHLATPVLGELNSHYQMAEAAYHVGISLGIIPEAARPPTPTLSDQNLSKFFQTVFYNACPPRQ